MLLLISNEKASKFLLSPTDSPKAYLENGPIKPYFPQRPRNIPTLKMEVCGAFPCPVAPRQGAGILLFGYGNDEATRMKYLNEAEVAAQYIKAWSTNINITIVTNGPVSNMTAFDSAIQIYPTFLVPGEDLAKRGDHGRQWLTRLYYLASTPYILTFALDSNVQACADPSPVLAEALDTDFDWAVANQHQSPFNRDLKSHNFALMYKWSKRTAAVFDRWIELQLIAGKAACDQGTLTKAILELRESISLKVRKIRNSVAAALIPSVPGKYWPRVTRLLDGSVTFFHKQPGPSAAFICHAINRKPQRRVLVVEGVTKEHEDMRTQILMSREACMNETRGLCFDWDWNADLPQRVVNDPFEGLGWL
jgi:hypothetical protein